jgi:hypothetical protein
MGWCSATSVGGRCAGRTSVRGCGWSRHADSETAREEGHGSSRPVLPAGLPLPARGTRPAGPAEADTLYVVGGLYGNPAALAAVLERAHQEPGGPATIVFNGDFHWLDVDPDDFRYTLGGIALLMGT